MIRPAAGRYRILGRGAQNQQPASHRPHAQWLEHQNPHHVRCFGNPQRFVPAAGQRHDSKPVPELLDGLQVQTLLADKAYNTDKIVQAAQGCGMQVIIPCRVNGKKNPLVLDKHRYKARHLVKKTVRRPSAKAVAAGVPSFIWLPQMIAMSSPGA